MRSRYLVLALVAGVLGEYTYSPFPPPPKGVTTLQSKYHKGVTISYREPGICETTPGVKSYSGYVHLPPGLLNDIDGEDQDYPINTFYWFFESRKDPTNAPLSIWLNGGPGGSSLMGLFQENGPCFVDASSNETYLNPYSWNNEVNMLFLDQPSQVGFSYDVLTNGTIDLEDRRITPVNFTEGKLPEQNNTFYLGTFSSQSNRTTANSTTHAAHAIWHFAQTWFQEFPFYKPHDDRVSLWTESYGGKYGPSFFKFFQEQNEKISNGTINEEGTKYVHLDTLGIVNGCVDELTQTLSYAEMAYNNTYGIKAYNESMYNDAVDFYWQEGGCRDKIVECRKLLDKFDPENRGNNVEVNRVCSDARVQCEERLIMPYMNNTETKEYAWFDIAHPRADPFPVPHMQGYLSQQWVQEALGVPVNFTPIAMIVNDVFTATGDPEVHTQLDSLAYLLDNGVKVALMYGDRDYACNWIGGEQVSLAVPYAGAKVFEKAGYTPIITTVGVKGQVRQHGNFSFSRVYEAGHMVPSYQPEVALDIFTRALFNRDIATGLVPVWDNLITMGPRSTWHIKNEIPEKVEPKCYVLSPETCEDEVFERVKNGTAVVKDYFVVEKEESMRMGHEHKEQDVLKTQPGNGPLVIGN